MTRDSQEYERMKRRKIIAGVCFLAIIFFVTLFRGGVLFPPEPAIRVEEENKGETDETGEKKAVADQEEEKETEQIVVDVAGAVSTPGILFLPAGSRVYEAVEQVGGLTEKADLREVNLASELSDGEKLYIPSADDYSGQDSAGGEEKLSGKGTSLAAAKSDKVNINIAGEEELQMLSGVGPSMAKRIVDYREEHGRFKKMEDLKNVKGIGEKTFEKLKDSICIIK